MDRHKDTRRIQRDCCSAKKLHMQETEAAWPWDRLFDRQQVIFPGSLEGLSARSLPVCPLSLSLFIPWGQETGGGCLNSRTMVCRQYLLCTCSWQRSPEIRFPLESRHWEKFWFLILLLFLRKLTETLNIFLVVLQLPKFILKLKDYKHCKSCWLKIFQVTGKGTAQNKIK